MLKEQMSKMIGGMVTREEYLKDTREIKETQQTLISLMTQSSGASMSMK